jgi:hypothetical protein
VKALRILLTLLLAPVCLLAHDPIVILYERYAMPVKHGMLSFGLYLHYTGWFFVILLPLCIFLGNMWWTDRRRYLPHLVLLVALVLWSMGAWASHPNRTLLFLVCCWATLPLQWVINRILTIAHDDRS